LAKKADLNKFFPNKTKDEIIETILEKGTYYSYSGELQISDKERDLQITNMQADIATIIAEKCVHPVNSRHFTLDSIKAAMKEIHYPVKSDHPAKRQAL
jgi:ribosome maturation protein SDO1